MRITMQEVLTSNGLPTSLLHNPRVTKALARELVNRGFRRVSVSVDGERRNYWTNDDGLLEFDAKKLLDNAIGVKQ